MKYFFYGQECSHCHAMMPIVDRLISEGHSITKLETWHNQENFQKLQALDNGVCGGVPFFYNESTGASLCGEVSEDAVRSWLG